MLSTVFWVISVRLVLVLLLSVVDEAPVCEESRRFDVSVFAAGSKAEAVADEAESGRERSEEDGAETPMAGVEALASISTLCGLCLIFVVR